MVQAYHNDRPSLPTRQTWDYLVTPCGLRQMLVMTSKQHAVELLLVSRFLHGAGFRGGGAAKMRASRSRRREVRRGGTWTNSLTCTLWAWAPLVRA